MFQELHFCPEHIPFLETQVSGQHVALPQCHSSHSTAVVSPCPPTSACRRACLQLCKSLCPPTPAGMSFISGDRGWLCPLRLHPTHQLLWPGQPFLSCSSGTKARAGETGWKEDPVLAPLPTSPAKAA